MKMFFVRHVAYDTKTLQLNEEGKVQLDHLCRLMAPFFTTPATMMSSSAPWVQATSTAFAQKMGADLFAYLVNALNAPIMGYKAEDALVAVASQAIGQPNDACLVVFTHREFASQIAGAMFCNYCQKSILLPDLDLGAAWMIDTDQKKIILLDFRKLIEVAIFESA